MKNALSTVSLLLLLCSTASAQAIDPLRFVSGTTLQAGDPLWLTSSGDSWRTFGAFSAHVTYVSETGPEEQRNEVFSTNWAVLGAVRDFDRGFFLARARVSLEPFTISDPGYPQILQYIPAAEQPIDWMRPHDFLGEAAVQAGFRPTASTLVHLYVAPAGDPALGTAPDVLRASSREFAEAPFAWDLQESFHAATSVVTAGFATSWISVDGSVFHDASRDDEYTSIDSGDLDSKSARVTLTPSPSMALQVSRGELGEDAAQRTISSASLTWRRGPVALSALWTQREFDGDRDSEVAYGAELLVRANRHSLMARAEWVDRPSGFPEEPFPAGLEQTTHVTAGYLFDFLARTAFRTGVGVNIDYHTQSYDLEHIYGHKPQSIYAFVRVRSGR